MQFYDGAVLESFVFKIKEDIGLYKLGNPICQTCLLVYFLVDLSLQLGSLRMADENILKRMIWLRIVHRIKSILEYSEPLKKKSLMNPVPSYFFYLERLMYESYLVGDEFPAWHCRSEYEPREDRVVKQSMNILGLALGIVAFLIFVALAFFDVICAESHDYEHRPHRKKHRHSRV